MDEVFGEILEQARIEFINRMQTMQPFVTMLKTVNPNLQAEFKEVVDTWASKKSDVTDSDAQSLLKDQILETLSPTDTDYHSDSSKHSLLDASTAENMNEMISVPKNAQLQTALACTIPSLDSAQHSPDTNSASQTPSSVNSSPVPSPANDHLDNIKASLDNDSQQSRHANICKVEPNSSVHNFQDLKIDIKEGVIAANASFKSFNEFERVFNLWKATYLHPFRVASSEQLRNADGTVDEVFKYKYIVYHCAHYGKPRMRGSGKRPNQNYLPCGCRAMLRLNYAYNTGLRITTLNDQHYGHEITPESYAKSCSKIRRFSPKTPSERQKSVTWRMQQQNITSDNSVKYEFPTSSNTPVNNNAEDEAEKN